MSAVRSSRRASAGPRIGRRFLALLAVACVAGISATAALAWSQYYEQNTSFSAGDLRTSAYNSGVDQVWRIPVTDTPYTSVSAGQPTFEIAIT